MTAEELAEELQLLFLLVRDLPIQIESIVIKDSDSNSLEVSG